MRQKLVFMIIARLPFEQVSLRSKRVPIHESRRREAQPLEPAFLSRLAFPAKRLGVSGGPSGQTAVYATAFGHLIRGTRALAPRCSATLLATWGRPARRELAGLFSPDGIVGSTLHPTQGLLLQRGLSRFVSDVLWRSPDSDSTARS